MFDSLCNDPGLSFHMDLQIGDIQLVHNHTQLHDRTECEDWPESERRRHLPRLWLAPEQARALPDKFTHRYGNRAGRARRCGTARQRNAGPTRRTMTRRH